jgi:RNA recognition motif-containing protein
LELRELFSKYGEIASCKIEYFNDGSSRGFGYVQYVNKEDAANAIKNLNEYTLKSKKL